jgi:acyl-coenzyme A synthetase/AMP-(fatty) acid ligase/acyl carrier protein
MCEREVTILNQTPSAFRQLMAAQSKSGQAHRLRHVIFGGEALEVATLKGWHRHPHNHSTRLINMYGITETTVHVTYRLLELSDSERAGSSPIGCRIPDLKVYLLDSQGRPVPIGVVGEIYVGGAGVARSYLNRPELTAERFVADPFAPEPGSRMYKTGDLGRYLADANLEFLGRNDSQVKIRGFRIELGEIEARLAEHPAIREAAVVVREGNPGDRRLVAYLVAQPGTMPSISNLREFLKQRLPEYMVPAAYVMLDSLPLTVNGKLDRRALPVPDLSRQASDEAYVAPRNAREEVLVGIWAQVLGLERVGINDNFFELGGHSLLATQLLSQLRQTFQIEIPLRLLFEAKTVAELAEAIGQNKLEVPSLSRIAPMASEVPALDDLLREISEAEPL